MDKEVYNAITLYKKNLESQGIRVGKIFLFGSYAYGQAREYSDIDFVIVSNDFKKMDLWERMGILGKARVKTKVKKPMEVLAVTEDEFAEAEQGSFLADEVKAKGVEIT